VSYQLRPICWTFGPEGEPIYSEMQTTIEIVTEGNGEFVEVSQNARADLKKISIDPSEWPALRGRFESAREAAGVHFELRQIRAKALTDRAERDGLRAAQEQAGHASITTTEIYVRGRRGKLTGPTR